MKTSLLIFFLIFFLIVYYNFRRVNLTEYFFIQKRKKHKSKHKSKHKLQNDFNQSYSDSIMSTSKGKGLINISKKKNCEKYLKNLVDIDPYWRNNILITAQLIDYLKKNYILTDTA